MSLTTLPIGVAYPGLSGALATAPSGSITSSSPSTFSSTLNKVNDSDVSDPLISQADAVTVKAQAISAPNLKRSEGVLKTVYDPINGREFVSPVQAWQYGVTNYVETQPAGLPMPNSLKGYSASELADLAKQFNVSVGELINKERQGELRSSDSVAIKNAIATESNGLKPAQLVEKLKAFKATPPTTFQQFQEQQGLWADYANRYANSSWNYANMDGKPQDHSLKPDSSLPMQFTGYAEPINQMLSSMGQQTPQFREVGKLLQAHPEINDVVNTLYSMNPEQSFFNALNPKYSGGTPSSTMASNFAVGLQNLGGNIETMGKDVALKQFLGQQQNLLVVLPDATGKVGNLNLASMSNPQFREMQKLADVYTPKISDAQWTTQALASVPKETKISEPYRDAVTGKGVAIQYAENGKPEAVRLYDASAQVSVVYNDPAKLVEGVYASGIPLDAFSQLAKQTGTEVLIPNQSASVDGAYVPRGLEDGVKLSDIASGKLAQVVASDDWVNFKIADAKNKSTTSVSYAGGLNDQIAKIRNQNSIAKAFCSELKLTAAPPAPSNMAQLVAANQIAANTSLSSTVDSFLGSIDAQLNYVGNSRT